MTMPAVKLAAVVHTGFDRTRGPNVKGSGKNAEGKSPCWVAGSWPTIGVLAQCSKPKHGMPVVALATLPTMSVQLALLLAVPNVTKSSVAPVNACRY